MTAPAKAGGVRSPGRAAIAARTLRLDSSADNYYNLINKNKPRSIVMTAVS